MPPVNRSDAARASATCVSHNDHAGDEAFELSDFEAELERLAAANLELMEHFQTSAGNAEPTDAENGEFEAELGRLSAANQELMEHFQTPAGNAEPADDGELDRLTRENARLRARIEELESVQPSQDEEQWLERQREYETLLEEKSEVIRSLHLKLQEVEESAIGNDPPPVHSPSASGMRLGQAEEILRLKRELEGQRRQLEQDEQVMMGQMREMELAMAKERAEMARQRQDVTRLQADLNREIENASRDPELRERLNTLRRQGEARPPSSATIPTVAANPREQQSSGFFRRIFG